MDKPQECHNLLNSEIFQTIWAEMEQEQINSFSNSRDFEYDERERAYTKLTVLKEIKAHLQSIAAQGEINKKRFKIL